MRTLQVNEAAYSKDLAEVQRRSDRFADLEASRFMSLPCSDRDGRQVVLCMPQNLPLDPTGLDLERLYLFTIQMLDSVANAPFSVVYVHTGAEEWRSRPSMLALRNLYERYGLFFCMGPHHSDAMRKAVIAGHNLGKGITRARLAALAIAVH